MLIRGLTLIVRVITSVTFNHSQGSVGVQARLTPSGLAHDDFRRRMRALLEEVKARGEPKADDQSISGLLLKLKVHLPYCPSVSC